MNLVEELKPLFSLIREERWTEINEIIANLDMSNSEIFLLLYARATLAFREKLPSWKPFIEKLKIRITDHSKLKGLIDVDR